MAVRFDAAADALTRTTSLPPNQAFSICGWAVRRVDLNASTTIFSHRQSAAGGVSFVGINSDATGDVIRATGTGLTAPTLHTMVTGEPFFWGLTWNATGVIGYSRVHGSSLTVTNPTGTSPSFTPGNLCVFNRFATDTERFDGSGWNVKCWNRAISALEMLTESECADVQYPIDLNFHWRLRHKTDTNDVAFLQRHATVGGTLESDAIDEMPANRLHGLWVPVKRLFLPPATSGAITGSADMVFGAGSSSLTGAGALAGSADLVFGAGASTLRGTGALTGTAALVFGGTGALTGLGALAGTAAEVFGGTGALTGTGALAGTAAITIIPTGTLAGVGAIAGSTALVFDLTGSMAPGALAGSADMVFGGTGALTGTGALAGTADMVFGGAGSLDQPVAVVTTQTPAGRPREERYIARFKGQDYLFSTLEGLEQFVQWAIESEKPKPKKLRKPVKIRLTPDFAEEVSQYVEIPARIYQLPVSKALEQVRKLEARVSDEEDDDWLILIA